MRPIKVIDFFSGCGGTSVGLRQAGFRIVLGIDNDADAHRTFARNFPEARALTADIRTLETSVLDRHVGRPTRGRWLFSACAPCQPFSQHRRIPDEERAPLLLEFARFVAHYKPDYVLVENVPGMQRMNAEYSPFVEFQQHLRGLGYSLTHDVIDARGYGVPQRRRRLVLLASLHGEIRLPSLTHGPGTNRPYATVRQAISHLPPLAAGESYSRVANHSAAAVTPRNLKRLQATPEGGTREDWPDELWLDCHRNHSRGKAGHSDSYGRLAWDSPACALTTKCTSITNGRFGHPEQDRALSAREAACLQSFPRRFVFLGSGLGSVARQIGNAVPPRMAKILGRQIIRHACSRQGRPEAALAATGQRVPEEEYVRAKGVKPVRSGGTVTQAGSECRTPGFLCAAARARSEQSGA